MLINNYEIRRKFEDVQISVPPAVVLGTEIFDQFLEDNSLRDFALNTEDDRAIFKRFIEAKKFPLMYIAYRSDQSSGSEVVHNDLRARYNYKEPEVLKAMEEWAGLAIKVRESLESGNIANLPEYINRNFDLRKSIIAISKENIEMVETARSVGASAKFTGSGGAIIGTYKDDAMFAELKKVLSKKGIEVLKPEIVNHS